MYEGDTWGGIGVEVAEALRIIAQEAMTDAGLPTTAVVTARTAATADRSAAGVRADLFLYDLVPFSATSANGVRRAVGLQCWFLLTVDQPADGSVDDQAIRAFGAILGRIFDRPIRVYGSQTLGDALMLYLDRLTLPWPDLRDAFAASDRPLARAAAIYVKVAWTSETPDVVTPEPSEPAPARDPMKPLWPVPVAGRKPPRLIVVHGDTPASRRAAAAAAGLQLADVDPGSLDSAYKGETEKALNAALSAAAATGAALLLDDADALLGKRTDVRDAHDRFANVAAPASLPAGSVVVVSTADPAVVKRLAAAGAEVIEAPHPAR